MTNEQYLESLENLRKEIRATTPDSNRWLLELLDILIIKEVYKSK